MFAIGVAVYIFYSAYQIGHEAFQQLMDRELPDEILQKIQATAMSHPEVLGTHETRTRQSGQTYFVQMHLELGPNMRLRDAHRVADEVEAIQRVNSLDISYSFALLGALQSAEAKAIDYRSKFRLNSLPRGCKI